MISAEELTMLSDRAVGRLLPKIALLEADAILALTPSFDFVQLVNMYLCKKKHICRSLNLGHDILQSTFAPFFCRVQNLGIAIFDMFETVGYASLKFAHNFEPLYFAD